MRYDSTALWEGAPRPYDHTYDIWAFLPFGTSALLCKLDENITRLMNAKMHLSHYNALQIPADSNSLIFFSFYTVLHYGSNAI